MITKEEKRKKASTMRSYNYLSVKIYNKLSNDIKNQLIHCYFQKKFKTSLLEIGVALRL